MLLRPSPLRVEHIDLNRLSGPAAREAMSRISDVHRACWPDKPMENVYTDRLDRESVDNELWLVRGQGEAVIGFMHGISEDLELLGTKVLLMRSFGAAHPEWRAALGGLERIAVRPLVRSAVRGRLRGRLPLVMAHFASPATYRTFLRIMPRMVPIPGTQPDPHLLRLRDAAVAHYGLERVPGRAHACRGPRVAMSAGERAHWNAKRSPEIRFFVEECPGFADGEYLTGLVPMDWSDLAKVPLRASLGVAREWIRRRTRRASSPR